MVDETKPTENKTDKAKSLTRPIITGVLVLGMVGLGIYLGVTFGDSDLTKLVVGSILTLAGVTVNDWFRSR